MLVGHQSQLAKPGDYFLAEVAGESLIVVKDQRSTIRAYYNVCRHRGARLCEEQNGHAAAIQCPYHAWTYALDGRLIGAPHMDETRGFNKAEYPLKQARLGLWEGFIFLNLADASASLEKWFEPLEAKVFALEPRNAALGETDRIRRPSQLEVNLPKLRGVLSLFGRASGVVENFTVRLRRE